MPHERQQHIFQWTHQVMCNKHVRKSNVRVVEPLQPNEHYPHSLCIRLIFRGQTILHCIYNNLPDVAFMLYNVCKYQLRFVIFIIEGLLISSDAMSSLAHIGYWVQMLWKSQHTIMLHNLQNKQNKYFLIIATKFL